MKMSIAPRLTVNFSDVDIQIRGSHRCTVYDERLNKSSNLFAKIDRVSYSVN